MGLRLMLLLVAGYAVLSAEAIPVTATLSLKSGQSVFKTGEPIILNLTFIASSPGYLLNVITTEPVSSTQFRRPPLAVARSLPM